MTLAPTHVKTPKPNVEDVTRRYRLCGSVPIRLLEVRVSGSLRNGLPSVVANSLRLDDERSDDCRQKNHLDHESV